MGYSNIKADRQHEADQRRIRELEAQLQRERNQTKQTAAVIQQQPQTEQGGHVTIEKTSKVLKKQLLSCWIVLIIGLFLIVAEPSAAALFIGVGFVGIIVTKIQIWWRHG